MNKFVLMPGSYNPLHSQHLAIALDVEKHTGVKPVFEICRVNADKGQISQEEIDKRCKQFSMIGREVIVTNNTSFVEKAIWNHYYGDWTEFKNSSKFFAVGTDTIERIDSPKYYFDNEQERDRCIKIIADAGWRFLVYPRKKPVEIKISACLWDICEVRNDFIPIDISSTQIRNADKVELRTIPINDYFEYNGITYQHKGYTNISNSKVIVIAFNGEEYSNLEKSLLVTKKESWFK